MQRANVGEEFFFVASNGAEWVAFKWPIPTDCHAPTDPITPHTRPND